MNNLPIFVQLKNKPVLVVGGGEVALRKVQTLLKAGAKVKLVATEIDDRISFLAGSNLRIIKNQYSSDYLTEQRLVVAATDDHQLN